MKVKIFTIGLTALLFIIFGCSKKSDNNNSNNNSQIPVVTTNIISNVEHTSATCGGDVYSEGSSSVTAKGVCWSTSQVPTISSQHTTDGNGTGTFTSSLTGLSSNTVYYVRAYATNNVGTAYGLQINFTTINNVSLPNISTNTITTITQTTAVSGGTVASEGSSPVTVRGICWSTSSNPITSDNHTSDGSGVGSFTSNITGLTANTTYYVRAYATNNVGTSYGDQVSFKTLVIGAHSLFELFGGGMIFYLDSTAQHGLIAALSDQSVSSDWGCETVLIGTGTGIGTGKANTVAIVNGCSGTGFAARICNDLVINGYSDWFLPSKDELNAMYRYGTIIGGFASPYYYWSSSEYSFGQAWCQLFPQGEQVPQIKNLSGIRVRAIRAF